MVWQAELGTAKIDERVLVNEPTVWAKETCGLDVRRFFSPRRFRYYVVMKDRKEDMPYEDAGNQDHQN